MHLTGLPNHLVDWEPGDLDSDLLFLLNRVKI